MHCPDFPDIEHFLRRDRVVDDVKAFDQHLASCLKCQENVKEVAENLRLESALRSCSSSNDPALFFAGTVESIGPYRILRVIGRGGMGVVYEAQQQNPRRIVALKVLHSATQLDDHYTRLFRREVQVLARLEHPSIAAIHEAGQMEDGRPYFAMEFVDGVSLLQFAQREGLPRETRLQLFKEVCDAISYAHQRGVIHRDLKPSNILVNPMGRPKVLDFGLAKVLDVGPESIALTAVTEVGRIQGTLPYMSPEQVRGDSAGIDIRSDVYSLGVVFYELLLGRLPYAIDSSNLIAAARVIAEQPPELPGTLDRSLRGDLETILKKTLEKDKERRYQSAAELSEDIRRYLHDETIIARPPSRSYQLRKFARRNKLVVAAVATVFMILVAGIAGVTVALHRARNERDRAVRAEQTAERRRGETQAVNDFLADMLRAADPGAGGRDLTVRDALDRAALKIDTAFQDQSRVKDFLQTVIGQIYFSLGVYDQAEAHLQPALEAYRKEFGDHADVASCMQNLASLKNSKGDLAGAEPLFREAIAMRKRLHDEKIPEMCAAWNQLAVLLQRKGDFSGAEAAFDEALTIQRAVSKQPDASLAGILNNLGSLLTERGELEKAERVLREAVEIRRQLNEMDSYDAGMNIGNLATALRYQGKYDDAEPLQREALAIQRKALGDEHPNVGLALHNLGVILQKKGNLNEAEPLLRESLRVFEGALGPEHSSVGIVSRSLGAMLLEKGETQEAEVLIQRALTIHRKALPPGHWQAAVSESSLGECLMRENRLDEAEPLLIEGYSQLKSTQGENHRVTLEALDRLVRLYDASGKPELAANYRALRENH